MATMANKEHLRFYEKFIFPIPMKLADKRGIRRKRGKAEAAGGATEGKAKTRGRESEREDGTPDRATHITLGPGSGLGRH